MLRTTKTRTAGNQMDMACLVSSLAAAPIFIPGTVKTNIAGIHSKKDDNFLLGKVSVLWMNQYDFVIVTYICTQFSYAYAHNILHMNIHRETRN